MNQKKISDDWNAVSRIFCTFAIGLGRPNSTHKNGILINFNDMDKAVIKAKKVECIIGLFFLLPPVLGVFAFVFQLFGADTNFSMLRELSVKWTESRGMSAAPVYLGLMAIAGVYLIKDSFYALFVKNKQNEK